MIKISSLKKLIFLSSIAIILPINLYPIDIAITLDDFPMADGPILNLEKRTEAFIASFKKHHVKAAFFCVGGHFKTKNHILQLSHLDNAGHFLANHTINHTHASKLSKEDFKNELILMDQLLSPYSHFKKWYRFPYLDYGNRIAIGGSIDKHVEFMKILEEHKYQDGFVTINTLDWLVNQKLKHAVHHRLQVNLEALKKVYIQFLKEWIRYYLNFYKIRFPFENIKHSLLLHANDINALFMDDIIEMIKEQGWNIISPELVFNNPTWRKNSSKNLELINIMAPSMKSDNLKKSIEDCFSSGSSH